MTEEPITGQFGPKGEIKVNLAAIKSVGIKNITDLKTYHKSQYGNRVMHIMEFNDGGTCELTYLTDGTLEVFRGDKISVQVTDGQHVVIGQSGTLESPSD